MPLWPHLTYLSQRQLHIAYRASAESQRVVVEAELAAPAKNSAWFWMQYFRLAVNRGLWSGAEFAPQESAVDTVSQPNVMFDGTSFRWELTVKALSPLAFRTFLEAQPTNFVLARCSIVGELSPDDSALSVDSERMTNWLEQPGPYVGRTGKLSFPLTEKAIAKGFSLRVGLTRKVTGKMSDHFFGLLGSWNAACTTLPSPRGELRTGVRAFREQHENKVLAESSDDFDALDLPARDWLVNGLEAFHHEVCPIASAEILFAP